MSMIDHRIQTFYDNAERLNMTPGDYAVFLLGKERIESLTQCVHDYHEGSTGVIHGPFDFDRREFCKAEAERLQMIRVEIARCEEASHDSH